MSEDEVLPQASYTAEGKERIRLWRNDLADLAKDAGAHAVPTIFGLNSTSYAAVCMHMSRKLTDLLSNNIMFDLRLLRDRLPGGAFSCLCSAHASHPSILSRHCLTTSSYSNHQTGCHKWHLLEDTSGCIGQVGRNSCVKTGLELMNATLKQVEPLKILQRGFHAGVFCAVVLDRSCSASAAASVCQKSSCQACRMPGSFL